MVSSSTSRASGRRRAVAQPVERIREQRAVARGAGDGHAVLAEIIGIAQQPLEQTILVRAVDADMKTDLHGLLF